MSLREICRKDVETIQADTPVKKALRRMIRGNFNSFVVVDEHGAIVGTLSVPDITAATVPTEMQESIALARSLIKPGFFEQACKEVGDLLVKDVMRTEFTTIRPDSDLMEIAAIYLHQHQHAIPVVEEDGTLVGMVTRTEIKVALAQGMGLRLEEEK